MKRVYGALGLALLLCLLSTTLATAHPLGNFSVNRYSRIDVARDEIRLRYVLDLAEIPTLQELRTAGAQSAKGDPAARQAFLTAKADELVRGARLTVAGQPAAWSISDATLDFLPGQADLDTMRVALTLRAPLTIRDGAQLEYRDTNYAGRVGWHEVILRGGAGVDVTQSTVPGRDLTDELRSYPQEAERAPLDVSAATATLTAGGTSRVEVGGADPIGQAESRAARSRFALDPRADMLAALLRESAGPLPLLVALVVAAGLGALHALEPGHGKTVVGSYLVGSRGTAKHAMFLGLTVTVTHTLGVYALGLVTLVAAQYILPERLYPILGTLSGVLVVLIGLSLVWARFRAFRSHGSAPDATPHSYTHEPAAPDHLHTNTMHVHADGHLDHAHDGMAHHTRDHVHASHRGLHASHEEHEHSHVLVHAHTHGPHEHSHAHTHQPDGGNGVPSGYHTHGWGRPHTHALPEQAPITMKSLLVLGVSGGLLPCPSALVVLLAAISFQSVALGMLLVAAFSVGLATVLTGIGLVVVFGGRLLERSAVGSRVRDTRLLRAAPALGAVAITVAGAAIAVQAASGLV
jgi:ABC-type nickel/cobalt efflux system permease component RcnA